MSWPSCSRTISGVVLLFLILVAGLALQRFHLLQVRNVPDTATYLDLPLTSLNGALNHARTPGYPLFLAAVKTACGSFEAVPLLQFLLYAAATFVFYCGLLSCGCSRAASPWIAGALLACNNLWYNVSNLATDALAGALGIASVGLALLWGSDSKRAFWWGLALLLTTASSWLVRPASLFLLPVIVILAPLIRVRTESGFSSGRGLLQNVAICCLITFAPLILYCSLRLALLGKFSIVAFGGFNLIGISGQFLDAEMVPQLREELQPLARAGLERLSLIPENEFQFVDLPRSSYMRMESNSDLFIWKVFAPAAHELAHGDPVQVNTLLKSLGMELVFLCPRSYANWLLKATLRTMVKLFGDAAGNPLGTVLILLISGSLGLQILKAWTRSMGTLSGDFSTTSLIALIAILYAGLSMILVILICPPIGRMTDAAGIWLGPLLTAFLTDLWGSRMRSPRQDAS